MIRSLKILPGTGRGTNPGLDPGMVEGVLSRSRAPSNPPIHGRNGFSRLRRSTEHGFTLVELMVVILIIGLLATIVIINVMPAADQASVTKARADIATLESGVEMYRLKHMRYPAGDGLQALVSERLVKRLPNDPWGNPYRYAAPGRDGREFEIYSYGADGREGGEDQDADIGNWDS